MTFFSIRRNFFQPCLKSLEETMKVIHSSSRKIRTILRLVSLKKVKIFELRLLFINKLSDLQSCQGNNIFCQGIRKTKNCF